MKKFFEVMIVWLVCLVVGELITNIFELVAMCNTYTPYLSCNINVVLGNTLFIAYVAIRDMKRSRDDKWIY